MNVSASVRRRSESTGARTKPISLLAPPQIRRVSHLKAIDPANEKETEKEKEKPMEEKETAIAKPTSRIRHPLIHTRSAHALEAEVEEGTNRAEAKEGPVEARPPPRLRAVAATRPNPHIRPRSSSGPGVCIPQRLLERRQSAGQETTTKRTQDMTVVVDTETLTASEKDNKPATDGRVSSPSFSGENTPKCCPLPFAVRGCGRDIKADGLVTPLSKAEIPVEDPQLSPLLSSGYKTPTRKPRTPLGRSLSCRNDSERLSATECVRLGLSGYTTVANMLAVADKTLPVDSSTDASTIRGRKRSYISPPLSCPPALPPNERMAFTNTGSLRGHALLASKLLPSTNSINCLLGYIRELQQSEAEVRLKLDRLRHVSENEKMQLMLHVKDLESTITRMESERSRRKSHTMQEQVITDLIAQLSSFDSPSTQKRRRDSSVLSNSAPRKESSGSWGDTVSSTADTCQSSAHNTVSNENEIDTSTTYHDAASPPRPLWTPFAKPEVFEEETTTAPAFMIAATQSESELIASVGGARPEIIQENNDPHVLRPVTPDSFAGRTNSLPISVLTVIPYAPYDSDASDLSNDQRVGVSDSLDGSRRADTPRPIGFSSSTELCMSNPEQPSRNSAQSPASTIDENYAGCSQDSPKTLANLLTEFFVEHDKGKIRMASAWARQYKDREDKLFAQMGARYGDAKVASLKQKFDSIRPPVNNMDGISYQDTNQQGSNAAVSTGENLSLLESTSVEPCPDGVRTYPEAEPLSVQPSIYEAVNTTRPIGEYEMAPTETEICEKSIMKSMSGADARIEFEVSESEPLRFQSVTSEEACSIQQETGPKTTAGECCDGEAVSIPAVAPPVPLTLDSLLQSFYQQHQPDKLANVPSIAREYAGKADELVERLRTRYGRLSVQGLVDGLDLLKKHSSKQEVGKSRRSGVSFVLRTMKWIVVITTLLACTCFGGLAAINHQECVHLESADERQHDLSADITPATGDATNVFCSEWRSAEKRVVDQFSLDRAVHLAQFAFTDRTIVEQVTIPTLLEISSAWWLRGKELLSELHAAVNSLVQENDEASKIDSDSEPSDLDVAEELSDLADDGEADPVEYEVEGAMRVTENLAIIDNEMCEAEASYELPSVLRGYCTEVEADISVDSTSIQKLSRAMDEMCSAEFINVLPILMRASNLCDQDEAPVEGASPSSTATATPAPTNPDSPKTEPISLDRHNFLVETDEEDDEDASYDDDDEEDVEIFDPLGLDPQDLLELADMAAADLNLNDFL